MTRIYLDYNATTPVYPEVHTVLSKTLHSFANPASSHTDGQNAAALLEESRESIARMIGAQSEEIVFTSGATESNTSVLHQLVHPQSALFRKNLCISTIEHSSISEYAEYLSTQHQITCTSIPVTDEGFILLDTLTPHITSGTLVSLIWAHNEIGTIQDAQKLAETIKELGGIVHFDASQAVGKIPVSMQEVPADFLTISSHKIYGPRGIGALYVRSRKNFAPLFIGGGQEDGQRSGTANHWLATGFATAIAIRETSAKTETTRLNKYRLYIQTRLHSTITGIRFNGSTDPRTSLAGTLSITLPDIDNETLVLSLDIAEISVSAGSACLSRKFQSSHTLTAIGLAKHEAARTIRVSMGAFTTKEEVEVFCSVFETLVHDIRHRRAL